jgi:hypothetical protein
MKLRSKFLTALSVMFACTMMTSCSDDDKPNPDGDGTGDEDVVVTPTSDLDVYAFYYGDYYENGTGNYGINLITPTMEWDDDNETYLGPGELVYFELNSNVAENADFAQPSDGDYTFTDDEDDPALGTFSSAYVITYDAEGNATENSATGGTITVAYSNGAYTISGKFILSDGSEYPINLTKSFSFLNRSDDGYLSNLTGDVTISGMTQSQILFWGETFTETSDYCSIIIAGDDYDLDENSGNSPAINVALNLTPGSTSIPEGTYEIIDFWEADDFEPFTAASGIYFSLYGGYLGTWYFNGDTIEASMLTGSIDVKDNGNGNYTFTFNLADGYGHKVTGSYTGTPEALYYDEEE